MMVSSTRYGELVSGMLGILFYCMKIIGLAPVSLQTKVRARNSYGTLIGRFVFSKIGLFYNLVYLILVHIAGVILTKGFNTENEANPYSTTQTMHQLQEIVGTYTAWFIIIYWAFRQKKAAIFMTKLVDVHCLLLGLKEKLSYRRPFLSMVVHVAVNVLLWIPGFGSLMIYYDSFLKGISSGLTTFVVHCFFLEYSIILILVTKKIEILNKNLSNLRKFPEYLLHTPTPDHNGVLNSSNHSQLAVLDLLCSIFTTLLEVCEDIENFFSLPILFAIGSFSLKLIYAAYYLTYPIIISSSDTTPYSYVVSVTWFLLNVYPLLVLSYNVTEITNKAKLTRRILHKLLSTAKSQEVVGKLEQFYRQATDEEVNFTAYGFFSLDFTLIQSIFSTTITYLVIIIQFVRSDEMQDQNHMNISTVTQ